MRIFFPVALFSKVFYSFRRLHYHVSYQLCSMVRDCPFPSTTPINATDHPLQPPLRIPLTPVPLPCHPFSLNKSGCPFPSFVLFPSDTPRNSSLLTFFGPLFTQIRTLFGVVLFHTGGWLFYLKLLIFPSHLPFLVHWITFPVRVFLL